MEYAFILRLHAAITLIAKKEKQKKNCDGKVAVLNNVLLWKTNQKKNKTKPHIFV